MGVFFKITGGVGSGEEVFKLSRVELGLAYPTRPDPRGVTRPVNSPDNLLIDYSTKDDRREFTSYQPKYQR